jgi:hypothetical protein
MTVFAGLWAERAVDPRGAKEKGTFYFSRREKEK